MHGGIVSTPDELRADSFVPNDLAVERCMVRSLHTYVALERLFLRWTGSRYRVTQSLRIVHPFKAIDDFEKRLNILNGLRRDAIVSLVYGARHIDSPINLSSKE
jgi:hypothetical protein